MQAGRLAKPAKYVCRKPTVATDAQPGGAAAVGQRGAAELCASSMRKAGHRHVDIDGCPSDDLDYSTHWTDRLITIARTGWLAAQTQALSFKATTSTFNPRTSNAANKGILESKEHNK